ncbi:alpha/beta hydrolase family protein [Sandaracinobacter sp.]|uniref:alpha/beta hydrolase family protein n=1 Tax=Sandaracinobacter sp. TaxID=2487581 RepID=UPI0035AF8C8F
MGFVRFMSVAALCTTALVSFATTTASAQDAQDLARKFGARPGVEDAALSPDGQRIAYLSPAKGQGAVVQAVDLVEGAAPKPVFAVDGNPQRLSWCIWVTAERLVCDVWGTIFDGEDPQNFSRTVSFNRDGTNPRLLSARNTNSSWWRVFGGGGIVDWLPTQENAVLMARIIVPDDRMTAITSQNEAGLALERIDTATLKTVTLEKPLRGASEYITDGHGTLRIRGIRQYKGDGYSTGITLYQYRLAGSNEWRRLSQRDSATDEGFDPYAVDREQNIAYGFDKYQGRQALFKVALDGSEAKTLVLARKDVDVDGLVRIGRHQRVVGAAYTTDRRTKEYFDPTISKLHASLSKALPDKGLLGIVDSSVDEQRLLIIASSDNHPGTYYLFDRTAKSLSPVLTVRPQLEGMTLAEMKPIEYPAADGTMIPGYLTLPPGKDPKNLPAIVLPHGGPSARDDWGFDWLSQFYAAMGYAVLQPNFRGSAGYGDAWLQTNGFQSWKTAIGDVSDAGRWLVKQGIADPKKLGIVGWSYGGYAALQSAVVDPALFRAVVAIAPVTDLTKLKDQYRHTSARTTAFDFIGAGPHITEGSPAQRAAEIKVPVMLFHGALDVNVDIAHSKLMADKLKAAGATPRLVTWDNLDHYLIDSEARTKMLFESEAFLRQSFGN